MNTLFKQIVSSLSAMLLFFSTSGPVLAITPQDKSKHRKEMQKKIPPPPKVKVNTSKGVLNVGKREFSLKDNPSDLDIARARVFQEPLVPMEGVSSAEETKALVSAIREFKQMNNLDDVSAFMSFSKSFPSSRWSASIKTNVALLRFKSGYLSEAIQLFEEAWQVSKKEKTADRKVVADKAVSYLMLLQARLGMLPKLTEDYKEIANRKFSGSDLERIVGAKTGIMLMRSKPGISFKCGPYAVNNVANIMQKTKAVRPEIAKAQSTKDGTSLAFLKDLSDKSGVKLKLAKRSPGAKIIAPSVMHWKLGHFAAVVGEEKGRLHIIDPTFDLDSQSWITMDAFEKETDGNFLVPENEVLPDGWQALSQEEAKHIFGKGVAIAYDDNHPKPDECMDGGCDKGCKGMAKASAGAMNCTLQISDSPLGYQPPVGPSIDFNVSYMDMQTNQPGSFSFSNLGLNWNFNWLSYLSLDVSNVATVRVLGGGSEVYTPVMGNYTNEWQSRALLVDVGGGAYERRLPDGTVEIYNLSDGGSPANIFLTHIIDPQLNHTYIYYDADFRIIDILDAINQVSTITYADNTFGNPGFYKIASITDPFSRSCSFTYDPTFANLISITDVMGMQSKFSYDPASSFITSMTTPYGTTSFSKFEPNNPFISPPTDPWRGMRFTFPDGSNSVLESWLNTPQCSFYWDRHAMELYPNDPINQVVTHAKKTAWVTDPITEVMWPAVWFIENPLESSLINYTYKDQFYLAPHSIGTSDQPASITRSLGGNGNLMSTVTIDGTITPGDVVGVHQNFDYCGYTVQSGDTHLDIANGLAKNINAYSNYRALGISAGSANNKVIINSLDPGLVTFVVFKSFGATETLSIFSTMAQTEDATVGGVYTPGDTFYVTIYTNFGTVNLNYTTTLTDTVADAITDLVNQINADSTCIAARVSATARGDTLHLISYERDPQTWALAPSGSEIITYSKKQSSNVESSYFQYDDFGNMVESIDPVGRRLTNIYDVNQIDLVERRATTEADNFLLGYWEYNGPPHLPTKFIDGSAQETNYEYNSAGQIVKITDADGGETKFEYTGEAVFDIYGTITSGDIVTLTVFDTGLGGGQKDVVYTVQPGDILDDIATAMAADINGDTDFTSIGITASSAGAVLNVTTHSVYQTAYNTQTSIGATVGFSLFSSNYGYLTKIDGPLAGSDDVTSFSYDGYGRLYSQTDSEGYVLLFFYDDMDRLVKTEYPNGTTETTVFDRLDAVLMTDRIGRTSQKAFDNMDRLAFEVDPLGRKTKYTWCSCGSLSGLTDANNNTTSWTHDLQGRVTSKIYPDSSTVNYEYEGRSSRLRSVTDALGQIKTFFYYPDGRLFQVNYSDPVNDTLASTFYWDDHFSRMKECWKNDAPALQYSYNNYVNDYFDTPITGGGMLSQVTNLGIANADITYSYDNLGRVINRSIDGANNSIDWAYDEMSRVTNETNALGSFDYHYIDNTPGSSKGTTRLESIDYPNGQVTEFTWHDNFNDQRLLGINNKKTSGGPTLSYFGYEYDSAGQIKTWSQQQGNYPLVYKLGYDQAGQLTSARAGLGKDSPPYVHQYGYSYDPGANRISAVKSTGDVAKISGTVTPTDVVGIIVNDASLPGGTKQIDYIVQSGDTLSDIARELSAAITSDSDMQSSQINAFAVMAADSPSSIGAQIFLRSTSNEPTVFKGDTSGGATESIELGYMFNGTMNAVLGGSATASDVVTVIVQDASLGGGSETESYTVQGGDTLDDVAIGLATAINGNTNLQNAGIIADSHLNVLNIQSRSTTITYYDKSFSGGATETLDFKECINGTQTAIIGGSVTSSDVLTLTIKDAGLTGGSQAINYTVQPGDTTSVIAAGLASAINASTPLQDLGITGDTVNNVLNIVSISPHLTTVLSSLSGGATETIALASSINVTDFGHNNLNELTSIAAGGATVFEGTTNKAVTGVTVDSNDAELPDTKHFSGSADLVSGANNIAIVGTDAQPANKTENQIVHATGPASATPTFDLNGNMTFDGTNTYVWDAENRLIRIEYPGMGDSSEFYFDAMCKNIRIVENVSSVLVDTQHFIWSGDDRSELRDGSGVILRQFLSLGQMMSTSPYFYSIDHLASIRELTDGNGDVQAEYSYSGFGNAKLLQGSLTSDFQFAGYYFHARSTLNFPLYRAYSSASARWLNRDPIKEYGGINLYSYVSNEPTLNSDPLGLENNQPKCTPDMSCCELLERIAGFNADLDRRRDAIENNTRLPNTGRNSVEGHQWRWNRNRELLGMCLFYWWLKGCFGPLNKPPLDKLDEDLPQPQKSNQAPKIEPPPPIFPSPAWTKFLPKRFVRVPIRGVPVPVPMW